MKLVSADKLNLGGSDLFKMEQGKTYRVSFAMLPGFETGDLDFASTPLFAQAKSMYIPKIGKIIDEGPQSEISGVSSKEYLATVIAVWPINRKNQFDRTRLLEEDDFDVVPIRLTAGRLKDIKSAYAVQNIPFGSQDLIMLCTDAKFQSAQYSVCPDSVLGMLHKAVGSDDPKHEPVVALFGKIMDRVNKESANLDKIFGREISVDELKQKLSELNLEGSSSSSGDMITGAVAPSASAPAGVQTSDVDDLLADL